MKKASTIMSIALVFALVAIAAFAGPASEGEAASATTEPEMVLDPSTGEMVKAPQYGGTIVTANELGEAPHTDTWWGSTSTGAVGLVLEKLGMVDWSTPRDKWDFTSNYTPLDVVKPHLAESFETPDPTTIIFHIREGIHWHDKAPMNGRELTADDIVFNFHRMTGLGSGFTEKSPYAGNITGIEFESITATDRSTVVFKLKQIDFRALSSIYSESWEGSWIYPPEVIQEHGNAQDWRNLVGTGPYSITDWVEGSAVTYTKNPNYWAFDEKFPENRLPYADEIQLLVIPDVATQLAALRAGNIALLRGLSVDEAESLQRTNPELVMSSNVFKTKSAYAMDVRKPPFSDIRVRQAMQLALDTETINQSLYGGFGDPTPLGFVGAAVLGFYTPFEEWPEEVKAMYGYDPERAEKLLDEAGYPRGSDGTRFKTELVLDPVRADVEVVQVAKDYWSQIGVDVEINVTDVATISSLINAHSYEGMIIGMRATDNNPLLFARIQAYSNEMWNASGAQDPEYDAIVEAAESASTYEEMQRLVKEAYMYHIKQLWSTWGPRPPVYHFNQPWLVSYNGEKSLGGGMYSTVLARLWIDQELRESMGH